MMGIDKITDILKQAAERLLSPGCSTGGRTRLHCDGKGLPSNNGIEEILKRFPPFLYQYIRRCYRVNTNTLSRQ